jgi:transcriptional regulator CtsR
MSIPKPPQDLTTSFTTTSGVPTFQSQLTIKTSDFTAAKTYMITIKASGGGHIHTKIVKVEVLSLPH